MSRHPYTHSCDFIRALTETMISRADASMIRQGIARAIGMDDEALAVILSNAEQAKTDAEIAAQVERTLRNQGVIR